MKLLRYALFALGLLMILACGGIIPGGNGHNLIDIDGIRFEPSTPYFTRGQTTVTLNVEVWAEIAEEENQTVRVTISGPLGPNKTLDMTSVTLGRHRESKYVTFPVEVDTLAGPGTQFTFAVSRSTIGGDVNVRPASHTLTIGSGDVDAKLRASEVSCLPGGSAQTVLEVLPVGDFAGTVTLTSSNPKVTLSPRTVLLQLHQTEPALVTATFNAPANYFGTDQAVLTASGAGVEDTKNLLLRILGSGSLQVRVNPTTIDAPVGGSGTATVTVTPGGGYTGTVNLSAGAILGTTTFVPPSLTFAAGETTPKTSTLVFTPHVNPQTGALHIAAQGGSASDTVDLTVHIVPAASFTLGASPATIHMRPGNSAEELMLTLTPDAGFTGNVTVRLTLPGSNVSLEGHTNPFTVNLSGGAPVTQSFHLFWNAQQGGSPPGGTATITATANGVTRTATFNMIAS